MPIPRFPIKSAFVDSTQYLDFIKQSIEYYFLILQDKIKTLRRRKFSLISNSIVDLYNDLISLYYRIKLQSDHCKTLLEAIADLDIVDSYSHPQISNLSDVSKELTSEFFFLQRRYYSSVQKQIVINA